MKQLQLSLVSPTLRHPRLDGFHRELREFKEFGNKTKTASLRFEGVEVPVYFNEFWTSRQRAAHSLHEISYRACFKPQLPRFFIDRFTEKGGVVYDPFMGRGTTLLEAALAGRMAVGCDINPLSEMLLSPRLNPPEMEEVAERLKKVDFSAEKKFPAELLVFYHPETLREIVSLRRYLLQRERKGKMDAVDQWIRMVAVNRLTGHSAGFFSVYTLPPNQAVTVESQKRINAQRQQTPPRREVSLLILKKTRQLLKELLPKQREKLGSLADQHRLLTGSADATRSIKKGAVDLIVTSPPFLDTVDYKTDNWLRGWFCGLEVENLPLWQLGKLERWKDLMLGSFQEFYRVMRPGGVVAFEVGEVRKGKLKLEEPVIEVGTRAGFACEGVMVNVQEFTKTSKCWGVDNMEKGTNSNRIVIFAKG